MTVEAVNASYELPFHGNRVKDGWQVVVVEQLQTGNPLNVITNVTTITGVSSVRPDTNTYVSTVARSPSMSTSWVPST